MQTRVWKHKTTQLFLQHVKQVWGFLPAGFPAGAVWLSNLKLFHFTLGLKKTDRFFSFPN